MLDPRECERISSESARRVKRCLVAGYFQGRIESANRGNKDPYASEYSMKVRWKNFTFTSFGGHSDGFVDYLWSCRLHTRYIDQIIRLLMLPVL